MTLAGAPWAGADPIVEPPAPFVVSATQPPAGGRGPSNEPATVDTPDGWRLTVGARDESQIPVPALTTAMSSREYLASGIYFASLTGPEAPPHGTLEVGYQIGCGIDMSTSNGVTMAGSAGVAPIAGAVIPLGPGEPLQLLPAVSTPLNGVVSVGLKPGMVLIVPVNVKAFTGANPWIMISNFHVKIDGCVGESFIRSYAVLTRETDESDVVLSYVGATKKV